MIQLTSEQFRKLEKLNGKIIKLIIDEDDKQIHITGFDDILFRKITFDYVQTENIQVSGAV